jgi:tape measure domain-containing protein
MASADTKFTIQAAVDGLQSVEGLKSAIRSLQGSATPAASDLNKLRDAAVALGSASNASENNLKSAVNTLKSLKDQASIASNEYRQFAQDIKLVENRLNSVTQAATQFKSASSGIASGGNAGAKLGPGKATYGAYGQMPFQSFDTEFWRKQVEEPGLGSFNQPQQFDYVKGEQAINQLENSIDKISELKKRARIEQLETQEKYNQLEIEADNRKQAAYLRQQKAGADAAGADYMRRLEATDKRKARTRGLSQSAGIVAASGIFGGPEGALGALGGAVLGGPGGAALGGALGAQAAMLRQGISDTAEYSAQIAKLNIALKGVTETTNEYIKAQKAINSVSKDFNVPILDATQAFTRLTASVKGAGGNVNDAEIVFRNITSAIKASGGSAEDVQSALLAMSQVFSKGKVSAEELGGQLGERLPGAVTLFAQKTNRTLPQLQKDLEQGVVGLNDLMKFVVGLGEKYETSALKISNSTEDAGARSKVALDGLRKEFGSLFIPVGSQIQDFTTKIANMATEVIKQFKRIQAESPITGNVISNVFNAGTGIATGLLGGASIIPLATRGASLLGANLPKSQQIDAVTVNDQKPGPKIKPSNFPNPPADEGMSQQEFVVKYNILQKSGELSNYNLSVSRKLLEVEAKIFKAQEAEDILSLKKLNTDKLKLELESKRFEAALKYEQALKEADLQKDNRKRQLERAEAKTEIRAKFNEINIYKEQQLQKINQDTTRELSDQSKEREKQLATLKESAIKAKEELEILQQKTTLDSIRAEYAAKRSSLQREILEKLNESKNVQAAQAIEEEENLKMQILRLQEIQAIANESSKIWADEISVLGTALSDYFNTLETAPPILDDIASTIGSGIGSAMESLVSNTKSWGDSLREIGSSVLKDIAKQLLQMSVVGPATKGISGLLGSLFPTAIKSIVPGLNAVGGPAFGMNAATVDAGKAFGMPSLLANGGIMTTSGPMPLKRYANGGIANSPQLAIYGEGRKPEAYVPLPDGRSIPVKLDAAGALGRYPRLDAGGNSSDAATGVGTDAGPTFAMNFETTQFLGQDWVSKDQLMAAMAATEKRATAAGAKAGAQQVATKMRTSSAFRRQVGV